VKGLEHAIIAQSGETKWLSVNAAPIVDQDGQLTGAIASFRDITDQKGTEERAKRYAVELKRSNEDLEQFAYAVSHDLQEPVRMVRSYLELLERRVGDDLDAKAAQFIDYAVDGAERMQEMIRALLSLSRVETRGRDFAPTDVGAVLDRTIMALGRVIHETGGEITYDPMPVVMADRVQLSQVFQNLIANALKFHRDGVEPRVHIRGYPPSDSLFPSGSLTRRGEDADSPSGEGWWTFTVTDNGIGIDPDQADRIFQVFQRLHTEEEYRGLGMGLALCKRIIERHGGRIWVESQTGEGSTFAFTLPASKGDRHG
jgi:light-regulated signal transduction histidine kinase (bacteriophytochrome)